MRSKIAQPRSLGGYTCPFNGLKSPAIAIPLIVPANFRSPLCLFRMEIAVAIRTHLSGLPVRLLYQGENAGEAHETRAKVETPSRSPINAECNTVFADEIVCPKAVLAGRREFSSRSNGYLGGTVEPSEISFVRMRRAETKRASTANRREYVSRGISRVH